MSSLDVALTLARSNVYVFPIDHPELPRCVGIGSRHDPDEADHPRGKHPCVPFTQKATTDPATITAWFTGPPRNVGIYCGKSRLVVLDEDELDALQRHADDHGVSIPPTFVVATGKGRHFYFEAPDGVELGNTEGALGAYHINVRAGNGYVVGPGSTHESGATYTVISDLPPAPLPSWVIDAIRTKASKAASNGGYDRPGPVGGDGFELPKVIVYQTRDDTLFRFAASLRSRSIPRAEAEILMRDAWERCEQPSGKPFTWGDALAKLDSAWTYPEGLSPGYQRATPWGATLATAPPVPPPGQDPFWGELQVLEHIREYAYAKQAAPWGVLGVCLLRMLAQIPPHVVLPDLIGSWGSLNSFLALVAPAGRGKGSCEAAAKRALDWSLWPDRRIYTVSIGSGAGLTHQYRRRPSQTDLFKVKEGKLELDGNGLVIVRNSVLFSTSEVDTLTAIAQRQNETLLSQLRAAWMGEALGFANADPQRRIPLEEHQYRFGLTIGVQPERAGPLLSDTDAGTPQRFVWLPATDPNISNRPKEAPPPLVIDPQKFTKGLPHGFFALPVPDIVKEAIWDANAANQRGEGDALDSHALFAREKIAQALTFLAGQRVMTEAMWTLSGHIMAVSDATRANVQARLSQQRAADDRWKAEREARHSTHVAETMDEINTKRVAKHIADLVTREGAMLISHLRWQRISGRDRPYFDEALPRAVDGGQVKIADTSRGQEVQPI